MMRTTFLSLVMVMSVALHNLDAQPAVPKAAIQVLTKSKTNGLWLRWAPVDYVTWQLGNRYGYTIERFTLNSDGEAESSTPEMLTPTPLRPLPAAEMERLSATFEAVAVVQELIYGEGASNTMPSGNLAAVLKAGREQENRFGIALLMCDLYLPVAKAAGLFFDDKTAIKGKNYIYRISLAKQPKNAERKPGVTVVSLTDEKALPAIKDVKATFGNRNVMLAWPVLLHKGLYAAYHVERSEDGKSFVRITDLPYVPMTEKQTMNDAFYTDSLASNNRTYHYRVIGISPFGETGPPSIAVSGSGKDDLSGLLILREAQVLEKNRIRLTWEFPKDREHMVNRFVISRASNPDGPYTALSTRTLASDKRTFIDETPHNNTYYRVKAINKAGQDLAVSFPYLVHREDATPPATPNGLVGTIDGNGVLTLTWNPNTDSDLLGYRVFITNSLQSEPVERTRRILGSPMFSDTINTNVLNKKVYFSVIAVDKSYNTSDYSKLLLLHRPDIIAPAAPVLTKALSTQKAILLEWKNSSSDDVARYELWRKSDTDTTNQRVAAWPIREGKTTYTDAPPLGQTYRYTLIAFDSSTNKGSVVSGQIFHETGIRPAITEFKAVIDRQARAITLKWQPTPGADRYILFRRENDGSFIRLETLDAAGSTFRDKDIRVGNQYAYKIQVILKSGVQSMLSDALKVEF